ncbi:porin [Salinicola sp. LHM]|uniref:porin n=1 Tax=Salinicola sp. LHM TaxID=3065298 RepID=UPI002ACD7C2C|nr:porin [Salinicola sp. LHM]WQH34267.1 porin [Salinicola sp. LHM]
MKKTLLATAIAGALGASAAAQAATVYNQDGTQLDIYGNIQIAYADQETFDGDANGGNGGVDSEDQMLDNGSTIGFSGQHIINPGLTGYFKAEFEHNADEEKISGGINNGDQAYLGLKGNFGDLRVGSWDPIIDDWIQDPISNVEFVDVTDSSSDLGRLYGDDFGVDANADREGDKVQYLSPSMGGLQFVVGTQYKGDAEGEYGGHGNDIDGYENKGSNASLFGGLKYAVGGFSVAAIYDDLNNYELESTTGGDDIKADAYGLGAQYAIGTLVVAAKAERTKLDYMGEDGNIDRYALGARYGYGFGDVYGAYQYVDADQEVAAVTNPMAYTNADGGHNVTQSGDYDGDDSFNEYMVGATYNLSPAMYTFVEYASFDREDDLGDAVSFGAVYSF